MTIKEQPLINAVSRLGALPGFLFSNTVVAGIFATLMCTVFGGFTMLFLIGGSGEVDALPLFDAVRIGAFIALIIAGVILLGIFFSAFNQSDEAKGRRLFVLGA